MGAGRADIYMDGWDGMGWHGIQLLQPLDCKRKIGWQDRTFLKTKGKAGRQARTWICLRLAGLGCVGHVGVELLVGCALR